MSTPRRDPPGSCVTTNQNDNTTPTSPAESDHTDNCSWPKFMQRIGYPHIEPPPEGDDQNNQTTLEINGTLNLITMGSDTYNDPAAPDFSKWPFPAKELPHTLANIYDLLDCPSISSGPRRCRGLPSQQSSFSPTQPLLYCVHAVHIGLETSYRRTLQHLVASRYYAFRMGTLCQSIILLSSGRPFYVWWAFSCACSHFTVFGGVAHRMLIILEELPSRTYVSWHLGIRRSSRVSHPWQRLADISPQSHQDYVAASIFLA